MRFISATQIFSGKVFLKDNAVLVLKPDGTIENVISRTEIDPLKIEQLNGLLSPGFVNTHCHLELSHLKDKIQKHTGIVDFGLGVIKHRNEAPVEEQMEFMLAANKAMMEQGIVAVGDISNSALSATIKQQSSLYYHTFVELIGLNPERAEIVFNAGKEILIEFEKNNLSASLAPHAPYSCSQELIKKITDTCYLKQKPTSIHNQESSAENEFFENKTGDYIRLYETLGLAINYFKASGKSSLLSVLPAFNENVKSLLVHNTFSNNDDIVSANELHKNLYWCVCPNANMYIENTLPDVERLLSNNCVLTIGTDSLASNNSLSVMEEINCLMEDQPKLSFSALLKAATYYGALFLGIENKFGIIEKNKKPGINLITKGEKKYSVKKLA